MIEDPLVEEIRSARHKLFEECHEDLDALLDRFREQEKLDQDRIVADISPRTREDTGTTQRRKVGSARRTNSGT